MACSALAGSVATWFAAVWVIGMFGGGGLAVQAATGIPAIIVLLVVMNWFFHRVYWTGWISHHHKRRAAPARAAIDGRRATLLGLGLLGFTSVYREGFEIVIFLQSLRVTFGSGVVLEGVVLGLPVHRRGRRADVRRCTSSLPYKRLLIITGVMLVVVLFVMVGEEINEMQLAGWIGTTNIAWMHLPGWAGTVVLDLPERPDDRRPVRGRRDRGRLLLCRRSTCACGARAGAASSPPASPSARRPSPRP